MKNENDVLTVGVFREVLKEFGLNIDAKIERLRDEMHQGFEEVRQEFIQVRAETAEGFRKVRIEIRDDIIDVIDQNIQPQLTSAVSRITRLERRVA